MDINCIGIESKRDEFRKYLEQTGATEKLTASLVKLYQEPDRPTDAIAYIRKQLCDGDYPDLEEIKAMRAEIASVLAEKQKEEVELIVTLTNLPDEQPGGAGDMTMKFEELIANPEANSLLKKFLKQGTFENLKALSTEMSGTLMDNIQCGLKELEHGIGVFASDQKAYSTFETLFTPILEAIHEIDTEAEETLNQPAMDWGEVEEITELDADGTIVDSNAITIGRALKDVCFMPTITDEAMQEVVSIIRKNLEKIDDEEFVGKFYNLSEIEAEQKEKWIKDGILFKEPDDKYLKAAGTYRYWPAGRGLFLNEKKNIRVWVNEEEHLQVTSFNEGGNLHQTYERLFKFMELLSDLEFARDSRWGFLAHNLENIGNTMRVIVRVKIPQLKQQDNGKKFDSLIEDNEIVAEDLENGVIGLSNKKRFGITEFDTVKGIQTGIQEIIAAEKCLYN